MEAELRGEGEVVRVNKEALTGTGEAMVITGWSCEMNE
jgi:hypothetical protein